MSQGDRVAAKDNVPQTEKLIQVVLTRRVRLPAGKDEAAVRKEIAEVVLEASAFIGLWKDQECAASDLPGLIKDRDITLTLRLLEGLIPHMLDEDARRLEEFIETTKGMLNSVEWRSPSSFTQPDNQNLSDPS